MIDIVAIQDILVENIKEIVINTTDFIGTIDDLLIDAQKSLPATRVVYAGATFKHQEGSHRVLTYVDVNFDIYVVLKNLKTKTELNSNAHQILNAIRTSLHGKKIDMGSTVVLKILKEELVMQQTGISVYNQTYTYRDRLIGVGA